MRRWIKRTLIGLLGATAIFGGLAAWAHKHHGHGMHAWSEQDAEAMKARIIEKAGKRLDLDSAQKAKLALVADAVREQRKALVGDGIDPRTELQSLVAGPTFDRTKASALIESKVSAVNSKSPALASAIADFYDSLQPTQQTRLRELMNRGRRG